jgi:formate hydrogenlyase subunit 3/multisubunit Na+/H+ antiporter MnhD subunit
MMPLLAIPGALQLHLSAVLGLFALAAASVACRSPARVRLFYGVCAAVTATLAASAVTQLVNADAGGALLLPLGLPWLGAHFRMDALSSFFALVVNTGGSLASVYGMGYGVHERQPRRVLPFYAAFLAAMNLVLAADDAFTFLVGWEAMSLASWALVLVEHRNATNRRAGQIYLVMAVFGGLVLLFDFGALAGAAGGYSFAAIRTAGLTPLLGAVVMALTLVGTGSKAGLVPLHVWLPEAHPAAPSHVSALMSGVMTKVAVYGAVRILFDLADARIWWWSVPVILIAAITAVLGVLYALMEHDLKRLLAYHTVENIGIIFLGLGLALAFRSNGLAAFASVALTAALLHALNHSLFKSLLFLGAGAVLHATGERDMEKLGGLIHRMPATAFLFLVGSVAISALPPLNGFVSEWLIFQAILVSPALPQPVLQFLIPAAGGLLALAAALAAGCFVKAFGITFLGRPRSPAAASARETDRYSLAAMAALALLCLLIGICSPVVLALLQPASAMLAGATLPGDSGPAPLSLIPFASGRSIYNGLILFSFIALSAWLTGWLVHRFASAATRRAPAWDCGFPETSPVTQYTASSFAQPIRRVFGTLVFRAREELEFRAPGDLRPAGLEVHLTDPAWTGIFGPVAAAVDALAARVNFLQFLTIRRYLSLMFLALVLLLLALVLWR